MDTKMTNRVPQIAKQKGIETHIIRAELVKRGFSTVTADLLLKGVVKKYNPSTRYAIADILGSTSKDLFGEE